MMILILTIPVTITMVLIFILLFVVATKNKQFDDLETPQFAPLSDDDTDLFDPPTEAIDLKNKLKESL
jgi:cbb3-type cytochrome oxidase maturation protein